MMPARRGRAWVSALPMQEVAEVAEVAVGLEARDVAAQAEPEPREEERPSSAVETIHLKPRLRATRTGT